MQIILKNQLFFLFQILQYLNMLIHLNTSLNRQDAKNNFNHSESILFSTVLYDLPEGKLCINNVQTLILK